MHIDWTQISSGAFAYGAISYALKTFPMPTNDYAKWFMGVLQYLFSNSEIGAKNFK